MYKYQGAIHIHTTKSDGTGDLSKIINAAKKTGLDFVIITDHNYIDCEEGIFDGIYVLKGQEISPKSENHYLIIGCEHTISPKNDLQENIKLVKHSGSFGFAAHPDESDIRKNANKPIKWTNKNIEPDGIEIWNYFSQWGDGYNSTNALTAAYSFIFRNNLVKKPYRETLAWWDNLNNKYDNIIPAIGGVDAHELIRKDFIIPVKVFSYEYSFKTIVNEITLKTPLSNDFKTAKIQIIKAIQKGNNIILNKKTHKKSPEIFIQNTQYKAYSGDCLELDEQTYLCIKAKKTSNILVFRNGLKYNEYKGTILKTQLSEKGKYRVEIEISNKGWAYSNPIIVK